MSDRKEFTLPRRTSAEDLLKFIDQRARGRDLSQIQSLNFNTHSFEGTLNAAEAFGLLDRTTNDLTEKGKKLALNKEKRKELLLDAVLDFEPYELLLEALFDPSPPLETPLEDIETWWNTHGYGSSQTNRSEGASSLARFIDFIGVGSYTLGRRGSNSRIIWIKEAANILRTKNILGSHNVTESNNNPNEANQEYKHETGKRPLSPENNTTTISLGVGRFAQLSLPPRVTTAEKQRLLKLVDVMVEVDDSAEFQDDSIEE